MAKKMGGGKRSGIPKMNMHGPMAPDHKPMSMAAGKSFTMKMLGKMKPGKAR